MKGGEDEMEEEGPGKGILIGVRNRLSCCPDPALDWNESALFPAPPPSIHLSALKCGGHCLLLRGTQGNE